jgi:hypothetical protein
VNGSNTIFHTSQPYVTGSTRVFAGATGDLYRKELGVDYTESASAQITFATPPASSTIILIDYDITASGVSYPVGQWDFNPNGYPPGAVLYNGPTLFPAGLDPATTQTAMFVLGPNGAQITVPAVFDGPAGQPALLNDGTVTTLSPGSSATFELAQTSAGGSGIASQYTVNVGIPKGDTGTAAANTLISPQPSDLEGTPLAGYMIGYDPSETKAQWQPILLGPCYNVTSIATTGTSDGQIRSLTTVSISGLPFPWIPFVDGDAVITGTVNTQVDLVARLGGSLNSQSGAQLGRGRGPVGTILGTNPWCNQLLPNFGGLLTSSFGVVAANTGATIYLNTEQQASTTDTYATGAASFTIQCVGVSPL